MPGINTLVTVLLGFEEHDTAARASRFTEVVERWRGIGLSTTPTDRSAAESAIRRCYERAGIKARGRFDRYECAGLKTPDQFIWLKSPLAGALACTLLKHAKAGVPNSVGESVVANIRTSISDIVSQRAASIRYGCSSFQGFMHALVGDSLSVWESLRDSVYSVKSVVADSVLENLGRADSVGDRVWAGVEESVGGGTRASVVGHDVWEGASPIVRHGAVYGSHEAYWLCIYSYFKDIFSGFEILDGLFEQADHCGWWWPFEKLVIATEKPVSLHLDDRGRPHHAAEPAICYGDGWGVFAWHGLRIPPQYYDQPVKAQQIVQESNAEIRRALIERYGRDRFFLDAGAVVLDRDPEHGAELIAIDLPDDPERRMVALKLRCPSTSAVYILRVPPGYRKARPALAWSYGLKKASE